MGLIPQDWCPYERRSGHRHTGAALWGRRERQGARPQREPALGHLGLGLPASGPGTINIWMYVSGAQTD